jgi:hypothetical protein
MCRDRLLFAASVILASLSAAACGQGTPPAPPPVGPAVGVPKLPPTGSVVMAKEDGRLAVALAAEPLPHRRAQLTATVVSTDNTGVQGLEVAFRARGSKVEATPCGTGCYTAATRFPRDRRVSVELAGKDRSAVAFELPARWPAPSASALVRKATASYRSLRSVSYVERLASGPTTGIVSRWNEVAPDRFDYRIDGGPAGIVIGRRRWDATSPGGRWTRSDIQPLRVPIPIWGSRPTNIHLLGTRLAGGRRVEIVSLLVPSIPAWFTIRFDRKTLHPISLGMTAAAHFMRHTYLSFNRPLKVRPPR